MLLFFSRFCSYRSPVNRLVLGEGGWVTHKDNGVCYEFDATRTMFSQGNITEKMRMGRLDCRGEAVVDLFAGVCFRLFLKKKNISKESSIVTLLFVEWQSYFVRLCV